MDAPQFSDGDILFLIDTLLPQRDDRERLAAAIRDDGDTLEAMLSDEALFQRVMDDEEVLVKISPALFFSILLRQARREFRTLTHTIEYRNLQKVVVFDTAEVGDLLEQPGVLDYLAEMLASFTRIHSVTMRVRVRQGIWRKERFNDFDVASLARYALSVDEEMRFGPYKRIADVCLFLAGMFPEFIQARQTRSLGGAGGAVMARGPSTIEEFELQGSQFFRLAAGHQGARYLNLEGVLNTLAEHFTLAEKPLAFLSSRYLQLTRHTIFGI
jgi:hypothetical protein